MTKIKGAFIPSTLVEVATGSIVSRQLIYNPAGNITLFAFDEGQQLSEHTAPFDAVINILEGEARITIDRVKHKVVAGEMIIMPANIPHAVFATKKFKMMLTMIKG